MGKNLVKFGGRTFLPARKAREIPGRISGQISWGFPKWGFCEGGGISITGVVRAPVAIINFAFFVRGLFIESYINSEILTRI